MKAEQQTGKGSVKAKGDRDRRERQRRAVELSAGAWRDEANPDAHTQEYVERELRELWSADLAREARLESLR